MACRACTLLGGGLCHGAALGGTTIVASCPGDGRARSAGRCARRGAWTKRPRAPPCGAERALHSVGRGERVDRTERQSGGQGASFALDRVTAGAVARREVVQPAPPVLDV